MAADNSCGLVGRYASPLWAVNALRHRGVRPETVELLAWSEDAAF